MFHPPHCPNPDCSQYYRPRIKNWYKESGSYATKAFGRVERYTCCCCGQGFSKQTFSIDYYAKRPVQYSYILDRINAGSGIRSIARNLNVKDQTVINRINRMGRNAVLLNQIIVNKLDVEEDLVLDGIQNYCVSQYYPDNYTVVVGKKSQFVYDCDYATLRRAGRMTAKQREKRCQLENIFKTNPSAIKESVTRLLEGIRSYIQEREIPLILYTDEKTDYKKAIWNGRSNIKEAMFSGRVRHHTTNSKVGRNQKNPLFAANYIDREIRKDIASQTRETVQFPRNVNNAMLRMNLYLFCHNIYKPFRIRWEIPNDCRHATEAGLEFEDLETICNGFLENRVFFPKDSFLTESAKRTVNRAWITPLKVRPEKLWKSLSVYYDKMQESVCNL